MSPITDSIIGFHWEPALSLKLQEEIWQREFTTLNMNDRRKQIMEHSPQEN